MERTRRESWPGYALALLSLLQAAPAVSAQDAASPNQTSSSIAEGARVRILTASSLEFPGLARVETAEGGDVRVRSLRAESRPFLVDTRSQTVSLAGPAGETIVLPLSSATLVGQVVEADDERVVIALDKRTLRVTIPRSAMTRVELSQGTTRVGSRWKGALKGLGIGVAGGYLLGQFVGQTCATNANAPKDCSGSYAPHVISTADDKGRAFALGFGAAGALAGALLGSHEVEHWQTVSLERGPSGVKIVAPSGRGLGVSLRVSF